ncbi:hypothetical protein [Bacillus pumilus]|nr:hypothetical protein [Bacillus pumilus]
MELKYRFGRVWEGGEVGDCDVKGKFVYLGLVEELRGMWVDDVDGIDE